MSEIKISIITTIHQLLSQDSMIILQLEGVFTGNENSMYETTRLILRLWRDEDLESFALMNQDPVVMEYYPQTYSLDKSRLLMEEMNAHHVKYGYGVYVVTDKNNTFIGMVGLKHSPDQFNFSPCTEIMWRIQHQYWGNGYVPEAACKCLELGLNEFSLTELVSFTPVINSKSQRVMQKIGMIRDFDADFLHPLLLPTHPLALHVLYSYS